MQNIFEEYIRSISSKFSHEETSEMGYRADFEILIKGIFESINVKRIDHDAKSMQGNKPDFVVLNHDIPILYIEAKDIGISLDKVEKSEQMARYYGYANLVLTDYVEFRFYRNGLLYEEPIKIANYNLKDRTINPIPDNYEHVAKTLIDFTRSHKEPIRSGKHLSKIMGGKAQRIRDNVKQFLLTESEKNTELMHVYETIKKLLVRDLTLESFADMYAQTLVYGLFVARYHDETPDNFTRQEARDLVPASNPLLRHFFDHIVGPDFDKRLEYIVNELCEVFSHANVLELMKQYFKDDLWGQSHEGPDPVIHFYEDFLKEYDAELRKKLGAFYTPLPVVRFIVRAVDYILEKEFNLSQGLADISKTTAGVHKVQILDPAVGTGTFLSEVIQSVYSRFTNQKARWPTYVLHDLLPRLHGFELMMAPYTIAHLKMSMILKETGFKYFNNTRLGIYLTNSLEMENPQQKLFAFDFAKSIAEESKEASLIKNKTPIMVVVGNPPYSVSSSNKGKWIQDLIQDYKTNLNEMNIQPLSDDYIKFIRFAEHFIEKNDSGIVAMITNNSFLSGSIHRQMRKHLLTTFDDIYILDLHGNSKLKEIVPNNEKDQNIFDIQQGVSINIFVRKNSNKKDLGKLYHFDMYGDREIKFNKLNSSTISNIKWRKLDYTDPNYFFVPKNFTNIDEYEKGFKLDEFFPLKSTGIKTHRDGFVIDFDKNKLTQRIETFSDLSKTDEEIQNFFNLKDNRDWNLSIARKAIINDIRPDNFRQILYRPFDIRWIFYSSSVIDFDRRDVASHMLKPNLNLILMKANQSATQYVALATKYMNEKGSLPYSNYFMFPLYLYSEMGFRVPNFNSQILSKLESITGEVIPEDIFDYIYAVLYSPSYRKKYEEFLKIDFPRVPYPKSAESFKKLAAFGTELRLLHLLESPKVNKFITSYPIDGSNIIENPTYKDGKVFINKDQYFGNVPELAWNFYIGGYQPAQKWLKDRKGRSLINDDIEHYQKMIIAMVETERIMKEIDVDLIQ